MKAVIICITLFFLCYGVKKAAAQKIDQYNGLSNFDNVTLANLKSKNIDTILFFKTDSCLKFKKKENPTSYEKFERTIFTLVIWTQHGLTQKKIFNDTVEILRPTPISNDAVNYYFINHIQFKQEKKNIRALNLDRRIGFMGVDQNFYFVNFYFGNKYYYKVFTQSNYSTNQAERIKLSAAEFNWFKIIEKEIQIDSTFNLHL
jgi:hypothetical protein